MSLFHGYDEWRHSSECAATFQYHPECDRSMFSWDDLAVSSSWYADSVLLKCSSATTRLDVSEQLLRIELNLMAAPVSVSRPNASLHCEIVCPFIFSAFTASHCIHSHGNGQAELTRVADIQPKVFA